MTAALTPGQLKRMEELRQKAIKREERKQRALAKIAAEKTERERQELAATLSGAKLLEMVPHLQPHPVEEWPALIADQQWLLNESAQFRDRALTIIREAHDAQLISRGVELLNDPLPHQPNSPWIEIRDLLTARPAAPAITTKRGKKPMITITLNIEEPGDIDRVRNVLSGLFIQPAAGTGVVTAAPEEPAKRTRKAATPKSVEEGEPVAAEAPKPEAEKDKEPEPELQPEKPVAAATEEEPGEKNYSPDDVLRELQAYAKAKGPLALRSLLTEFGAAKFGDLKTDQYSAVMAKAAA